jgi:hypothetical protein
MNPNGNSRYINNYCDIHVIISRNYEPERFQYIDSYFTKHEIKYNLHEIEYEKLELKKEYMRSLNYLILLKKCNTTEKPFVLILESDALFFNHFIPQLYNICLITEKSLNKIIVVDFFLFPVKNTCSLLYTRESLQYINTLNLKPEVKYSDFLSNLYSSLKISKPYILMNNAKLAQDASVTSGTKNSRYKQSFNKDPRMHSQFFSLKSEPHTLLLNSNIINNNKSIIEEFNKFIKKTYFICHPTYEKEKYEYINKFAKEYMSESNHEICCPTWGDKLKQSELSKFAQISKMSRPVISLVYNYIYIMKEIANTNPKDDDHFMILESDSLIVKDFIGVCSQIYNTILKNKFEYDYIDIGNGMGYFPQRFQDYTNIKSECKYSLYLTNKMRCTGGIIYKFSFIKSVLEYFEKTNNIMYAIDELYDCLVREKKIKIYWLHPSIVIQGSQTGLMESTIQSKDVIWDATNYDFVNYNNINNPKAEIEWEINDSESIKLDMDSKLISDVISKRETIIKLDNKNVSEIKLTPRYITTDKKVFIDVNCFLFNDSIELPLC